MFQPLLAERREGDIPFKKVRHTMKQTLILGNIITMDEKRPFAKAALAKDGVFAYIGDVEEAKSSPVRTHEC